MVLIWATVIAGVLGLAFGSFLNVCVSRWPDEKSVLKPRSYCPGCQRTLAWWENIPLVSWLFLRGRCRTCHEPIGYRHPLVELAVGGLWAFSVWHLLTLTPQQNFDALSYIDIINGFAELVFIWLLVGLAALDAENLWLPDRLILPGIALGFMLSVARPALETYYFSGDYAVWQHRTGTEVAYWFLGVVISAGVVAVVRFLYKLLRGKEGIGLGDVKLMAMLGGWLGAKVALLAFGIGVITAAGYGLIALVNPAAHPSRDEWRERKLPFGAFLCLGGIVGGFWGVPIVAAYINWAGL
jgi:leader peptidase (prepilin peptidase) / N-methyltransferase